MSIRHSKVQEFQDKLKEIFDAVDDFLEREYGDRYDLHPARPAHGETHNKSQSGLFNVGASFSAGYGSDYGRGYVLSVEISTLDHVPDDVEEEIDAVAVEKVEALLPRYFPDRALSINRDGRAFKIHGDLSLGSV